MWTRKHFSCSKCLIERVVLEHCWSAKRKEDIKYLSSLNLSVCVHGGGRNEYEKDQLIREYGEVVKKQFSHQSQIKVLTGLIKMYLGHRKF